MQQETDPYLPNVITSVKECSLRHYKWGKRYLVSPVAGVEAFLREFPHIVNIKVEHISEQLTHTELFRRQLVGPSMERQFGIAVEVL
jgi:hypothetical protein